MKKWLLTIFVLGTFLALGVTTAQRTLRLSYIAPEGDNWDLGAKRFAELVEERSGGALRVETFPGSILANRSQQAEVQAVQSGTIDMAMVSPILLALFVDSRFDMYSLPFLFPDQEVALATVDELRPQTDAWLSERGLQALAYGVNGFRQVTNSERVITSPEDMTGLKFRAAGTQIFLKTFEELGASAITMNFGEVFTSLQQGVIDGQENPLGVILSTKLYEVQPYATVWNYAFDPVILTMNAQLFSSFSADEQSLLQTAAEDAMQYERELAAASDTTTPETLTAEGMNVYYPSAEELAVFRDAVGAVYTDPAIVERIGAENLDLVTSTVERIRTEMGR